MNKLDRVIVDFGNSRGTIHRDIYGHFSEHIGGVFYDGLWVGEDSSVENIHGFRKKLVDSLKKIAPPVLRWPGGCFAETYDWRDGIGPRAKRPTRVNWWYSHDQRTESNQVGTHEFMRLCRLLQAEQYFAANMTTVSPLHIRNWIEYCNFPAGETTLADERAANGDSEPFHVRYWGIGNENWGGGGQMSPEMCAREYIRFATICNSLDKGNLRFIMCGANAHNLEWTRRLMKEWSTVCRRPEFPTYGMSIHYYTGHDPMEDPLRFSEDQWYRLLAKADCMQEVLDDHRAAMMEFDPEKKIGLVVDEWGCWHRPGFGPSKGYNLFEQQSNMRDAAVTALTLNIFNNRCDSVVMANVAQLVNNLHCLYLAGGENCIETPTYHVFDMFKTHQGGKHLNTLVHSGYHAFDDRRDLKLLSASASEKNGTVTVTMANLDLSASKDVVLSGVGMQTAGPAVITTLAHEDPQTCNTFEAPEAVVPTRREAVLTGRDIIHVPAAGIVAVVIER